MTGQSRIWSGEKKANLRRERAQNTYNTHVAHLNTLHSHHTNMLGHLKDMGGHLGNIGGQTGQLENYLQNLNYAGQQLEQYKSALAGFDSHIDTQGKNVARNELKLSSDLTKYKQDEENFTRGVTGLSEKKRFLDNTFKSFSDKAPAFGRW